MKLKISAILLGLLCLTCMCMGQIVPDYALRNLDTTVAKFPMMYLVNGAYNLEMIHDTIRNQVSNGDLKGAIQTLVSWKEKLKAVGDTNSFDYAVVQMDLGWTMFQLGDYTSSVDLISPFVRYNGGKSAVAYWASQRMHGIQVLSGQSLSALNQNAYLFQGDPVLKQHADAFDIEGMNLVLTEDSIYYADAIELFRQIQGILLSIRSPRNFKVISDFVEFLEEMIRLGEFNDSFERTRTVDVNASERWVAKLDLLGYAGASRNSAYIYGAEYLIRSGQIELAFKVLEKLWRRMDWELAQSRPSHFEAFPYLIVNGVLMEAHAWDALNQPRKVVETINSLPERVDRARKSIYAKTGFYPRNWSENTELLIVQELKIRACLHPDVMDLESALATSFEFFQTLSRLYQRESSDDGKIWLMRAAYSTMQQIVNVVSLTINSQHTNADMKRESLRVLLQLDSYKNRLVSTKWLGTIRSKVPRLGTELDQKLEIIREKIAEWQSIQVLDGARKFESRLEVEALQRQEIELLDQLAGNRTSEFNPNEIDEIDAASIYEALGPTEAIVYYIEGFSSIHRIVVQRRSIRIDELPKPGWLGNLPLQSNAYSQQITDLGRSFQTKDHYRKSSLALRKLLWPWETSEEAPRKVSVFPDGHLWKLSFDGLVYESDSLASFDDFDYLVRHHEISYWPGLKIWLESRSGNESISQAGVLSISPSFSKSVGSKCDSTVPPVPNEALVGLLAANKALEKLYGGEFLNEFDANELVVKELIGVKSVLSLGTHAFVNEEEPLASYLALYPTCDSMGEDGRLHAYEILSMKFSAELVMLWGCSTGKGKLMKGEGLLSLARAFLASGARSVLMSQWDMGEMATAKMMPLYFRHLANGLGKAEALRQAKLEFLQTAGPLEADPHQWAGWALIGDDHHLETTLRAESRRPWNWALVASSGLSLIFAVNLLRKRRKRTK